MEFRIKLLHLLLGFVVLGFMNYQLTEALQCYVCDGCVDGTELQEIQICGELPVVSSSAATTQPTSRSTTVATSSLQTDTSTVSTTLNRNVTTSVSRRRTTTTTPTSRRTTTRRTTTKEDTDEDYSDYEDYSDEEEKRHRIAKSHENYNEQEKASKLHSSVKQLMNAPKQLEPVCFMVKFRVNNTQMTNLGCTSMVKDNIFLTCQSLNRSDAIMEDCQLCGRNGCNKLLSDETHSDNDWDYPWFNSSNKMKFKIFNFFLIILLAKLIN